MTPRRRKLTAACFTLALALALGACSDDDNPAGAGPDSPEGQAAAQVMGAFVPLTQQLYLGGLTGFIPGLGAPKQPECTPLEGVCITGAAEFCPDAEAGTLTFDGCDVGGSTIDGTIQFMGTALSGSTALDLTIGDLAIAGGIFYELNFELGCFDESFSSLSFSSPEGSISANGNLQYCDLSPQDGSFAPTSGFVVGTISGGAETYGYNLWIPEEGEFEKGDVTIVIFDATFQNELAMCFGNLITGSVSCEAR
jgi:hypothetical protein